MVHVFPEETGSRYCSYADLCSHPFTELYIRFFFFLPFADIHHHIVSPLRIRKSKSKILQSSGEEIFHMLIMILQIHIIGVGHIQSHYSSLHQWCRCSYGQKIMDFFHTIDDFFRSDHIAKAPSCDGISLGKGVTGDRSLTHTRQRIHINMLIWLVQNMLVHFIGNDKGIILNGQIGNQLHLFVSEHLSTWIGRIAENQRLDSLAKGIFQHFRIEVKGWWIQRYIDRYCTGEDRICSIILIKRRKDNDFFSGIYH